MSEPTKTWAPGTAYAEGDVVVTGGDVQVVPAPPPSATDELVEAWYRERLCNRALPTDLQNSIRDDVDALKARLRAKEQ